MVQLFASKVKPWLTGLVPLLAQLFLGNVPILILAGIYGNNIGGYVAIAILMIILLAIGHESFYVIQQTNTVIYAPSPRYISILLMCDRTFQELSAIFSLWLTAHLWSSYEDNFIFLFAIIWTIATFLDMSILFVYKPRDI